jgi:dienelactone hydrolase
MTAPTPLLRLVFLIFCYLTIADREVEAGDPLPGTQPLTSQGDLAAKLVDAADRFLLDRLQRSMQHRDAHWERDFDSPTAYEQSVLKNRQRLAHILGVRDPRLSSPAMELVATTSQPALVGQSDQFDVYAVRWPVLPRVWGEGLLLVPSHDRPPVANVIAIPDADQTPEMICGLVEGVPVESQFARTLAANGCRVIVPVLIDRQLKKRGQATLTTREFLYRSAFELGRHLIGYELQKVQSVVDWFEQSSADRELPIGVVGWGEGGMLALYAAALDTRIEVACVSGYFGPRETIWQQPIDRNVFGLLEQFGDAEIASLVAPRRLLIETAPGPELILPGDGGAPATLATPDQDNVLVEIARANRLVSGLGQETCLWVGGDRDYLASPTLEKLLDQLGVDNQLRQRSATPRHLRHHFDPAKRADRQAQQIDDHNQWLLRESSYVRQEFMKDLDTSSMEAYRKSVEKYRSIFRNQVIGAFPDALLPLNVRTRQTYDEALWSGYEVVMDVFPDLFAYGILLVPKQIRPGERRPVVVCQHGLEGRPQQLINGDHHAYHDFAAKLAERGFVTFAPQNLYIFKDRFRTLQRKANPLNKTLFSLMVPQHEQIVRWLASLPFVDSGRVAFYGLSYGGKSAMRIPALVDGYCLSICSADFNEWVWKNASTRAPYSYVWTGEYEIFEFDLGSTFNYAEMAALIAPRPFMVERGHFDGVAPDEMVGHEFAKVRHLYAARLGLPDRCAIEWFVGPHTIHGQGTFEFLHKHLKFPPPK